MLKVENVSKYYDDFKAVDNLSFTVNDGEIFGLLGVNGAGKTTTFRMIINLLDKTEGTILLDGKPIDYSVTDKIGFLTEERSLLLKLTVLEQAIFYGTLKSIIPKFFYITKVYNNGAAWSTFEGARFLLIGVAVVSFIFLIISPALSPAFSKGFPSVTSEILAEAFSSEPYEKPKRYVL